MIPHVLKAVIMEVVNGRATAVDEIIEYSLRNLGDRGNLRSKPLTNLECERSLAAAVMALGADDLPIASEEDDQLRRKQLL